MPRYYESESLIDFVKQNTPHINGETTMECVERAIQKAPTADVVPKSEVGQWKILVEAQRKRIDELNKSKAEVARAFRQRMNEKMGKHTHLLGKEYVQRIMREIEKEFSEVENDR